MNMGDGSVGVLLFQTKEQAKAVAELDKFERFSDDIEEHTVDVHVMPFATQGVILLRTSEIYYLLQSSYRNKLVQKEYPCKSCGRELVVIENFADHQVVDKEWGSEHSEKVCIRFQNGDWKKPMHQWRPESR